ncbi:hypothetical protein M0R45_019164 [Rubus argutus]|uniref:Uncharacterized protein n=1 Tax=Rubus argutus TaxID=59490 RepID=A0AAW1X542_RUBAR
MISHGRITILQSIPSQPKPAEPLPKSHLILTTNSTHFNHFKTQPSHHAQPVAFTCKHKNPKTKSIPNQCPLPGPSRPCRRCHRTLPSPASSSRAHASAAPLLMTCLHQPPQTAPPSIPHLAATTAPCHRCRASSHLCPCVAPSPSRRCPEIPPQPAPPPLCHQTTGDPSSPSAVLLAAAPSLPLAL